jgi:YidC/Oxa1 family membrane protein insertase
VPHDLTTAVIFASTVGQIFAPVFKALGFLLSFFYSLIPNYIVAISLLTLTIMIISFPLNRASTRSMMKMQLIQPEAQLIRKKYKVDPNMTATERQAARAAMNEETMALYRENNVSMTGGCLPNLVILPVFIVLYDTIRGLTNTCYAAATKAGKTAVCLANQKSLPKGAVRIWAPRYILTSTHLYDNLKSAGGKMLSLGLNLADSVRSPQHSWVDVLPFAFIVALAVLLQYIQLRQMTGRTSQMRSGPNQMQQMQKIMPLMMAVIYISIPAAVVVYFIVSSLFRIGQQEWMYRRDPHIVGSMKELSSRKVVTEAKPKPISSQRGTGTKGAKPGTAKPGTKPGTAKPGTAKPGTAKTPTRSPSTTPKTGAGRPNGTGARPSRNGDSTNSDANENGATDKSDPAPKPTPRAQGKRERKPR